MLIIAVLAAIQPFQQIAQVHEIVGNELDRAASFQARNVSTVHDAECSSVDGRAYRRNEPEMTSLIIHAKLIRDDISPAVWWKGGQPSARSNQVPTGFSGYSIGEGVRSNSTGGSAGISTYDGRAFVDSMISYRGVESQQGTQWIAPDREGDKEFVEGIVRRTLATTRGLVALPSVGITVAGRIVATVLGPSGERLVDFTAYCQARNLTVQWNHRQGTASFGAVIVPLAARGIKAGPRWIETDDISLIHDGKWFVSFDALQEAT